MQATWPRGRLTAAAVLPGNPTVLAVLGFAWGPVSQTGEHLVGLAVGLTTGVLNALVVLSSWAASPICVAAPGSS